MTSHHLKVRTVVVTVGLAFPAWIFQGITENFAMDICLVNSFNFYSFSPPLFPFH
jgi:uncharacterized membrane protein